MPAIIDDQDEASSGTSTPQLPFPPVTREHILNCSYHSWHPKYRTISPKARLIPLSRPFLDYLRADGIVLPDDGDNVLPEWTSDTDSGMFSASDNADDEDEDVAASWRNTHNAIKSTISELGGRVVPKLNWSAPKDATWMNANTMMCNNPNEIYLLLKSSDFVTHDLEHAFDDTVDSPSSTLTNDSIPFHLVLRKAVPPWNPSVEFRCFVRRRKLLCICQRDINHFDFLSKMSGQLRSRIQEFFDVRLKDTFPDESFVFDVYIPSPFNRVWLVDINPWAPRTDPILFSWMELLNMPEPPEPEDLEPEFVRLSLNGNVLSEKVRNGLLQEMRQAAQQEEDDEEDILESQDEKLDESDVDEEIWLPELRLVRKNDPEAYTRFNAPQYSAHKLPKDVVDASQSGEGLREFARDWEKHLAKAQKADVEAEDSSDDDR